MQPKQVHNWSYSKNSKGFTLVLDKHIVNKETTDLFNTVFIDLPLKTENILRPFFENLIQESNKKDGLGQGIVLSGIIYLLNQLKRFALDEGHDKKAQSKTALKFMKLVSDTLSENLTVNTYAEKLHLTTERLVELCRESYGQSPKSIILDKKMTEAKRLLYFTDKTISQVAYQLGFDDSSYFSRLFKRKTGLSPTDFKSTR